MSENSVSPGSAEVAQAVTASPHGIGRVLRRSRPLRALRRNKAASISLGFLLLIAIVAVVGPHIVPHDPNEQSLTNLLKYPSVDHLLGTDALGRDVLSRLIVSTQTTVSAVLIALGVGAVIGIPLGLLAGMAGGGVDAVLSRLADTFLSLPGLILAIAIIGVLGPGLTNAMLAIGVVTAPPIFRLARGAAKSISQETYIEACRAVGCSPWRLLWRHVLPNASSSLIVQLTFSAGSIILAESSLSFLGIGVQPPQTSWGSMLREGFDRMYDMPFLLVPPTVVMVLAILALSTFGDGLRDALDGRDDEGRSK